MKYIFIFFVLNLVCFGVLAVISEKLPLFAPEQLAYLQEAYGITTNQEFDQFFDEMKSQGLILEMVNRKNLEVISAVAFLNLFTLITTIHLLIDKLFFKTIVQPPSIRDAIRRALLLSIIIGSFLFLRLYNLLEWYLIIFVLIIFLFIEFIMYRIKISKQDNLPEKLIDSKNEIH